MSRASIDSVAERLSTVSVHTHTNPYRRFEWFATLDHGRPVMSDGLLSLAGHPLLPTLSDEQRWQLGLSEMVHFFSLNIAGERELLTGLSRRLQLGSSPMVSEYLHHFLDEENAHMLVFAQFCQRYVGKIYPSRNMSLPRTFLPGEEEFLFFAQALVFEEIAAWFNRKLAGDAALCPLVREINEYHAVEEARHVLFGRAMLENLYAKSAAAWGDEGRRRIGAYLHAYVQATLRSYVDPIVYADAGLPGDAFALRDEALATTSWRSLEDSAAKRIRMILAGLGMSD